MLTSGSVVLLWSHTEFYLSIHPLLILPQNTNLLQPHEKFNIPILRKYTNWGEDSWTCKNMTDLPRHVLSTFLHSYLWQYRHNLHAVFCLEIVQSPVGVTLLCRWGPNTWMAAQYLELHMLKNENSPLKSRIKFIPYINLQVSVLWSQDYLILFLSILAHFFQWKNKVNVWENHSVCMCVCETSAITSFSNTHSLPLYFSYYYLSQCQTVQHKSHRDQTPVCVLRSQQLTIWHGLFLI